MLVFQHWSCLVSGISIVTTLIIIAILVHTLLAEMLYTNLASFLLLPAVIRFAAAKAACNNSPDLCDLTYDQVTYL